MARKRRASGDVLLRRFLEQEELTQQAFATRMSELRGWCIHQTQLARWLGGRNTPNPEMRALIAKATRGAVPVDAW